MNERQERQLFEKGLRPNTIWICNEDGSLYLLMGPINICQPCGPYPLLQIQAIDNPYNPQVIECEDFLGSWEPFNLNDWCLVDSKLNDISCEVAQRLEESISLAVKNEVFKFFHPDSDLNK